MDLYTAIEYICSIDAELEAVNMLLKAHKEKYDGNLFELCEKRASLREIYKINKARYKDEAIDALSDIDNVVIRKETNNA